MVIIFIFFIFCALTGYTTSQPSPPNSRKSSIASEDGMECSNSKAQLEKFDSWEIRRVNSAELGDNCYYCTAAGLIGTTTKQTVKRAEIMQNKFGIVDETLNLLGPIHPHADSRDFKNSYLLRKFLEKRLLPGCPVKFGLAYYPINQGVAGHMVAIKAWKVRPGGSIYTRKVDFQLSPNERFSKVPNNKWLPGGVLHLIDLNPPSPRSTWVPSNHRFSTNKLKNWASPKIPKRIT